MSASLQFGFAISGSPLSTTASNHGAPAAAGNAGKRTCKEEVGDEGAGVGAFGANPTPAPGELIGIYVLDRGYTRVAWLCKSCLAEAKRDKWTAKRIGTVDGFGCDRTEHHA